MAQRNVAQVKFSQSVRMNNREVSHFSARTGDPRLLSVIYDNEIGAVTVMDLRANKEIIIPLTNVVYLELDLEQQPEHISDTSSKRPAKNS